MNVTTLSAGPTATALEFGIYRDGDNNLDEVQSPVIDQAFATSAKDHGIAFAVEDFTTRPDFASDGGRRTESYAIRGGQVEGAVHEAREATASSRSVLAAFVAHTLDEAQRNGAAQTWLDLVDHGGGDAGGLETPHGLMRSDDIAGAIADGVAAHARAHPEDAGRRVDGVVANQCLMATLGFADALSHAGVRTLASSPETMLAPGVPTSVAEDVARFAADRGAMAQAMVDDTMHARYAAFGESYAPAAAFDVIDCDPQKIATMQQAVAKLDAAIAEEARDGEVRSAVRDDIASVRGMARFTHEVMPYAADRPALALYDTFAQDGQLPDDIVDAAWEAREAVDGLVLAHGESGAFRPFGKTTYEDAVGPTVHVAANAAERDPWAPKISETDTAFYRAVGGAAMDRALGTVSA